MKTKRNIKSIHAGIPASDGDGVKLTRIIGSHELPDLDPFLLLDHFGSDQSADYIGGFPPHPHRGFETVTYMLKGKMRHQDSVGNNGVIEDGGVQWMTAGKGIIHSEMPEQTEGMLSGFQLWVNLPSHAKMNEPNYQEFIAQDIPTETHSNGISIRVIAGQTAKGTVGPVNNTYVEPNYWDVFMPKETQLTEHIHANHNAFIFVYQGEVQLPGIQLQEQTSLKANQLAVLSVGDVLDVQANQDSRFIVVSGVPLNETVERRGPFVMNTREEINQAFHDYNAGNFA